MMHDSETTGPDGGCPVSRPPYPTTGRLLGSMPASARLDCAARLARGGPGRFVLEAPAVAPHIIAKVWRAAAPARISSPPSLQHGTAAAKFPHGAWPLRTPAGAAFHICPSFQITENQRMRH